MKEDISLTFLGIDDRDMLKVYHLFGGDNTLVTDGDIVKRRGGNTLLSINTILIEE